MCNRCVYEKNKSDLMGGKILFIVDDPGYLLKRKFNLYMYIFIVL